jgi:hypothetical protein
MKTSKITLLGVIVVLVAAGIVYAQVRTRNTESSSATELINTPTTSMLSATDTDEAGRLLAKNDIKAESIQLDELTRQEQQILIHGNILYKSLPVFGQGITYIFNQAGEIQNTTGYDFQSLKLNTIEENVQPKITYAEAGAIAGQSSIKNSKGFTAQLGLRYYLTGKAYDPNLKLVWKVVSKQVRKTSSGDYYDNILVDAQSGSLLCTNDATTVVPCL